jgi:hypothetical protein
MMASDESSRDGLRCGLTLASEAAQSEAQTVNYVCQFRKWELGRSLRPALQGSSADRRTSLTCPRFPDTGSEAMIVSERGVLDACTETAGVPASGG